MDADTEKPQDAGSEDARPAGSPRWMRAAAHVAAAALFLPVMALSTTFITDTDVFWHLASGDWVRRTGTIPRSDPFSFTVLGHRWVDIHWLFQVALSFVHEKGGWRALELLRSALILGVFAALFRRC